MSEKEENIVIKDEKIELTVEERVLKIVGHLACIVDDFQVLEENELMKMNVKHTCEKLKRQLEQKENVILKDLPAGQMQEVTHEMCEMSFFLDNIVASIVRRLLEKNEKDK